MGRFEQEYGPSFNCDIKLERKLAVDDYNKVTYSSPIELRGYVEMSAETRHGTDTPVQGPQGFILLPYMEWDDPDDAQRKITVQTEDRLELGSPFQPRYPTITRVDVVTDEYGKPYHLEISFRDQRVN